MTSADKPAFDKAAVEKKAFKFVPYLFWEKLFLPLGLFPTW
tara:strand:- start:749 stop:871 length:123 start_codon:yes stop_codon:yes gene_type:complete